MKAARTRAPAASFLALILVLLASAWWSPGCVTPPSCDAGACAEGQVRACVNACVTPGAAGQSCNPDPCGTGGVGVSGGLGNDTICQGATACELQGSVMGISFYDCEPAKTLAQRCDVSKNAPGDESCASGFFCRAASCGRFQESVCAFQVPQNGYCDSTWDSPKCDACSPG